MVLFNFLISFPHHNHPSGCAIPVNHPPNLLDVHQWNIFCIVQEKAPREEFEVIDVASVLSDFIFIIADVEEKSFICKIHKCDESDFLGLRLGNLYPLFPILLQNLSRE